MTVEVMGWETYKKPCHRGERIVYLLVKTAKSEATALAYATRKWKAEGRKVRGITTVPHKKGTKR